MAEQEGRARHRQRAEAVDEAVLEVLGETELDARTMDDTLGAVIKERDDLELVRDNLEEISSGG